MVSSTGKEEPMPLRDREEAGRELAATLAHQEGPVVVLALPRGGVPVGAPIAAQLGAPLDVLVARKIGAPHQPELGIGAVAEGGVRVRSEAALRVLGISDEEFDRRAAAAEEELRRRVERYRATRPFPQIPGTTAIVVDDGLATGVTAEAALIAVRRQAPARLVLAIPVAPPATVHRLEAIADEVVCLLAPEPFAAVGHWYRDFHPVSDDEVVALLGSG
jgi:putative phosphoribosyl transferase